MKSNLKLILLILVTVSCNQNMQDSLELGVIQNHDTTYLPEAYNARFFIKSGLENDSISSVEYFIDDHAIVTDKDTGKIEFTPADITTGDTIIKKSLSVKAHLITIRGLDTFLTRHVDYLVSNKPKSPRSSGDLVNGLRNGTWKFYRDNAKKNVYIVCEYKNGLKHGGDTAFYNYAKRQIREIKEWDNGRMSGELKLFAPNGRLLHIGTYVNGKKHGEFKSYGSSGKEYITRYEFGKEVK